MPWGDLDGFGDGEAPPRRKRRNERLWTLGPLALLNALGVLALGASLNVRPIYYEEPSGALQKWGLVNAHLVAAPMLWILVAALAAAFPQVGGRYATFALFGIGAILLFRSIVMIGLSGI